MKHSKISLLAIGKFSNESENVQRNWQAYASQRSPKYSKSLLFVINKPQH